ncbi:hypothetical protein H6F67_19675 [Microcoleus sp. FACHB-1515]|uniref:hypothetical protein n=1 Tax=Cyanophyceae TaxID=3028117 RepID=UPI001687005D|nr:hypothetical protein [Microcoleus sp. FACHB-1515]MBD2092072.1 hypothetical protein [Microcoleus sp. FACHB-1515]
MLRRFGLISDRQLQRDRQMRFGKKMNEARSNHAIPDGFAKVARSNPSDGRGLA